MIFIDVTVGLQEDSISREHVFDVWISLNYISDLDFLVTLFSLYVSTFVVMFLDSTYFQNFGYWLKERGEEQNIWNYNFFTKKANEANI